MIFAVLNPSPLTVCINCSFLHLLPIISSSLLNEAGLSTECMLPGSAVNSNKNTEYCNINTSACTLDCCQAV